jgi:hypothetical protein
MKECYSHSETGIKMIIFNYLSDIDSLGASIEYAHSHTRTPQGNHSFSHIQFLAVTIYYMYSRNNSATKSESIYRHIRVICTGTGSLCTGTGSLCTGTEGLCTGTGSLCTGTEMVYKSVKPAFIPSYNIDNPYFSINIKNN